MCVEGFVGCVGVRQAAGAGKDTAEEEQRVREQLSHPPQGSGEAAKGETEP